MQYNLGYGNRTTSVPSASNALPIPAGRPPQRILAPVTTLDTNQARSGSRSAVRPLPSYYQTGNQGASSSLARTYGASSSAAVPPQAATSQSASRPLSATRPHQHTEAFLGMDQRAPASAYASPFANTAIPAYQMRGISSSSQDTQALCVNCFPASCWRFLTPDLFSG